MTPERPTTRGRSKRTGSAGFVALTLAGLSLHSAPAKAAECITTSPPGAVPSAQLVVVASDATAQATFCGGAAGFSSDTFVVQDSGDVYIGTGNVTPSGSVVDLGAFAAGEELVFYIYVRDTGETFYSGPGSRNTDGIVHAAVTDLGGGAFHVGFEPDASGLGRRWVRRRV